MQSWSGKTRGRYQSAMKKWEEYCINKGIASDVTAVENCVNFLASLRESGLGYSAINTARSAMSATVKLVEGGSVGSHPLITRIMKGIFKEAPTKPRYVNTWDPNVVLGFIDKEDVKKLDLRELSQRLAMLMLLCSGQRCQTLAQLAANVQFTNEGVIFEILGLLKTSRPGRVQNRLVFRKFKDNEKICVVQYAIEYDKRKEVLRTQKPVGDTHFLVSFRPPHKAVGPSTLARWVVSVMRQAGVDVDMFKAHSTRGAGTSAAKGLMPMDAILKSGGWSAQSTFAKYYDRPIDSGQSLGYAIASRL